VEQQTGLQSELFVTDVHALFFKNPRTGEILRFSFMLCTANWTVFGFEGL